jgi:hypothetical protein
MLVVLTDAQLFPPQVVCQSCLLADRKGLPRWYRGRLCCGTLIPKTAVDHLHQYRCAMGFRLAEVGEYQPQTEHE